MKIKLYILPLFLLAACSTIEKTIVEPETDNVYISSGVEKFYLPELPVWVNFSASASCFRKMPIKYLNFQNLKKSYNLSYEQSTHLQHMVNKKQYAFKTSSGQRQMAPKDEAYIFHNVYQQVIGKRYDFVAPKYKKVSLIWIDPFIKSPKKIKKIMNRGRVLEGHPIFVSLCMSSYELENYLSNHGLSEFGVKLITSEMFSIYNSKVNKEARFALYIDELLKNKEITFFSPEKLPEVIGKFRWEKLE